jgi:hypothetical protein
MLVMIENVLCCSLRNGVSEVNYDGKMP